MPYRSDGEWYDEEDESWDDEDDDCDHCSCYADGRGCCDCGARQDGDEDSSESEAVTTDDDGSEETQG